MVRTASPCVFMASLLLAASCSSTAKVDAPPTVVQTEPKDGSEHVAVDAFLSVSFSEEVRADDPSLAFTLRRDGSAVAGTASFSGAQARFAPAAPLDYETTYTATLTTDVQDLAGNRLATPFTFSFSTGRCTRLTLGQQFELSSAVPQGGNKAMASDGTSIYVWAADFSSSAGTLLKVAPADGQVLQTESVPLAAMSPDSPPNGIQFVADIAWHAGALWATGVYIAPGGSFPQAIFRVDLESGLSAQQIPAASAAANDVVILQGLASDGVHLYAALDVNHPGGSADHAIVKFPPSASEVPLAPALRVTPGQATKLEFGDGALWVFNNPEIQKLDPSTGAQLANYCLGDGDTGGNILYLDHRLWTLRDRTLAAYPLP